MTQYRLYFLDWQNRVLGPPKILEAWDDQEAVDRARQFVDGYAVEVWDRARLIVRYPPISTPGTRSSPGDD